eukprot:6186628-Pleurochrysis_carterae.AAC.3
MLYEKAGQKREERGVVEGEAMRLSESSGGGDGGAKRRKSATEATLSKAATDVATELKRRHQSRKRCVKGPGLEGQGGLKGSRLCCESRDREIRCSRCTHTMHAFGRACILDARRPQRSLKAEQLRPLGRVRDKEGMRGSERPSAAPQPAHLRERTLSVHSSQRARERAKAPAPTRLRAASRVSSCSCAPPRQSCASTHARA